MKFLKSVFITCILLLSFSPCCFASTVSFVTARQAAQNWLNHASADSRLTGSRTFNIVSAEAITSNNQTVGYNFILNPTGHIIVPANDELPAVKLYSFTSTLKMSKPSEITEWIKEELFQLHNAVNSNSITFSRNNSNSNALYAGSTGTGTDTINRQLWARFGKASSYPSQEVASLQPTAGSVSIGPLLATAWNQDAPYNNNTPRVGGQATLTGCVATSAAQIMKYWNYPATGQGSTSYDWNGTKLSANFADSAYDWSSMSNTYSGSSTAAQQAAVAKLMSDAGIAFHMNYGTGGSAAPMNGKYVFKTYFKYKDTMTDISRSNYPSDSAWMQVFKNEVQNNRPSHLAMYASGGVGHAVVVDGYKDDPSEQIHINMGWGGSYDAWYVSSNIAAQSYNFNGTQTATIGIEPASNPNPAYPPTVTTTTISGITLTTATSGGNVTADGGSAVTARGVCRGTSPNPTTNCTSDGSGTGTFRSAITGLTANTTYYVRAYATNTNGTGYGSDASFKTLAITTLPTIATTKPMRSITVSSATVGGNVTSDGGSSLTDKGVCWGASLNPSANCKTADTSAAAGPFSCNIAGLTANTRYYARAYATNSNGTAYGDNVAFKTGKRPVSFVLQPIQ